MAAANDNRNASRKRVRPEAARALATMKRIIHDIYGPDATKQPNVEHGRDVAPEPAPHR